MTNETDRAVKWEVRPTPAARVKSCNEEYKAGMAAFRAELDLIQTHLQRLEAAIEDLIRKLDGDE